MPVMLLYTPFFHSDTAGMIFVSCTLYFLTLAVKEKSKTKSVVYAIIASLFIALGNTVKGSIAIMLISVMIFFVLKMGVKRGSYPEPCGCYTVYWRVKGGILWRSCYGYL